MPVVVAINRFKDDSDAEVELLKSKCLEAGAAGAVMANHWAEGGKGALELAEKVVEVCAEVRRKGSAFKFLYELDGTTIAQKIEAICTQVQVNGFRSFQFCAIFIKTLSVFFLSCAQIYCADGVDFSEEAEAKIQEVRRC